MATERLGQHRGRAEMTVPVEDLGRRFAWYPCSLCGSTRSYRARLLLPYGRSVVLCANAYACDQRKAHR
jgi:hypothetical protein